MVLLGSGTSVVRGRLGSAVGGAREDVAGALLEFADLPPGDAARVAEEVRGRDARAGHGVVDDRGPCGGGEAGVTEPVERGLPLVREFVDVVLAVVRVGPRVPGVGEGLVVLVASRVA